MNYRITSLLIGLVVVILFSISCSKEALYDSNGELIGYDPRLCPSPCCGGLQIKIDNITYPDSVHFSLVYQLPKDFSLGNNPQFPIPVKINYTIDSVHCGKNYVDISKIAIR
jgi:hypothetical protein